jgi:hypothetical protein
MSDLLSERGRALEDKFFAERDRQLLDAIRLKAEAEQATSALGEQTGVTDGPLLTKLVQLGVRVDTLAAFAVVPLLHVAWGDDVLDTSERQAILLEAASSGLSSESPAFALLEAWLTRSPNRDLFVAWRAFHADLVPLLTVEDRQSLADDLLTRCERVARASGGVFGIGAVSSGERAALAELKALLSVG